MSGVVLSHIDVFDFYRKVEAWYRTWFAPLLPLASPYFFAKTRNEICRLSVSKSKLNRFYFSLLYNRYRIVSNSYVVRYPSLSPQ